MYILLFLSAIGLTILCGYGAIGIIAIKPSLITIALGIGLASLGVIVLIFLIKFLFKTHKIDKSHLIEINRVSEPKLFELIDNLADTLGTHKPKKVFLSADVNASVFYDSNFWSMFFPIKKNLVIGLGLVNALTQDELKAILSHEFAHFSQKTMKVSSYVYSVNHIIHNLLYDNESFENTISNWSKASGYFSIFMFIAIQIVFGIQWVLRKMYDYVNTRHLKLSREMEFQADEIAANITGSAPLISSLLRMEITDFSFNNVLNFYEGKINDNIKPVNIYQDQIEVLKFSAKEKNILLKDGLPIITKDDLNRYNRSKLNIENQWSSHPSTKERVDNLEKINIKTIYSNIESANKIFSNYIERQVQLTKHIFKDVVYEKKVINNFFTSNFMVEYQAHHNENSFNSIYNGYYDFKDILNFDLNQSVHCQIFNLNDLFSNENLEDVLQLQALNQDSTLLTQIKNGEFIVKYFDYDGVKYKASESSNLINEIKDKIIHLEQRINTNEINIFKYFKRLETESTKTEKLTSLYFEYFQYDKEFDKLIEPYNEINESLYFISEKTPFEKIINNFKKIKVIEMKLKQNIDSICNNKIFKPIISNEIDTAFKKYLEKDYIYFGNERYFDKEMDVLFTALNYYQFVISKGYFLLKKKILDYQFELTKSIII